MEGELLLALKPLLREENRAKVDTAVKLLKLASLLPLLKDTGLFGKPEVHGHRRFGVILATDVSVEKALQKAERAYNKLEIKVL